MCIRDRFLELRPKRRRERDDGEDDRRSAEADGVEDEQMRDAEESARPHSSADEEMEVPDAGCGARVATLRVDQAQVAIVDLPGDTPYCAWRALIYAQLRAKGTQPTPELL
eukprot:12492033-Alexandrium_andersonii.AAC.1